MNVCMVGYGMMGQWHSEALKRTDAVLHTVACGDADLAVLLQPTPLDQMVTLAMGGERMPHKSTYFYPKLPTGLVINCFDV